ncbi:MAG: protein kinase [Planctomycetaceae bacterium]|nr:protein kinase [Planctomycetales bacterium]MCB9923976.1 protein kinase [Planctomycetaceae bacterium]
MTRMVCPTVEAFAELVSGNVSDERCEELVQHIAHCSDCAGTAEQALSQSMFGSALHRGSTLAELVPEAAVDRIVFSLRQRGLHPFRGDAPTTSGCASESETIPGQELDRELALLFGPQQSDSEIGQLGGYRILSTLGVGGMGVVFLAEDPQLQRRVALKVMLPGLAANAASRQRFMREAQAMASVAHEHIVHINQVGEDRGIPFLSMPFLSGETLDDRLKREGKLPVSDSVRIAREVAEGLAVAHEGGLIHRDIKPSNIWLEDTRGRVKILDFGLVRAGQEDTQLTRSDSIVGTPAYMSPEQASGEQVDGRSDLFSLGCVLYRMCTGQPPFQASNTTGLLLAVMNHDPPPAAQLSPELPAAFSQLILRLLAKKPDLRPASAETVVDELRSIEAHSYRQPVSPITTSAPSPAFRSKLISVGLLAALAIISAAVIIRITHNDGSTTELRVSAEKVALESDGQTQIEIKEGGELHAGRRKQPLNETEKALLSSIGLQLDGIDDYVHIPSLEFTGAPLTLEAWITPDHAAARSYRSGIIGWDWRARLSIDATPEGLAPYGQVWSTDAESSTTPTLYFGIRSGGEFQHVAMVLEDDTFQIFRDGQPNDRGPISVDGYRTRVVAGHGKDHFALGAAIASATRLREPSEFFSGVIHAARVSSSIRYRDAFAPGLMSTDADTVALYDFSQASGNILKDVSGHGHDGKIFGARWLQAQEAQEAQEAQPSRFSPFDSLKREDLPTLADADGKPIELAQEVVAVLGSSNPPKFRRNAIVAISPDDKTVAFMPSNYQVTLWDVASNQSRHTLDITPDWGHVLSFAFDPDGRAISVATGSPVVHRWDIETGQQLDSITCGGADKYSQLDTSLDRSLLAMLSSNLGDSRVVVWDLVTHREHRRFELDRSRAMALSPDGKKLAIVRGDDRDFTLEVRNVETGDQIREWHGQDLVRGPQFTRDMKKLLFAAGPSLVEWDVESGKEVARFTADSGWIQRVAIARDGRVALTWHVKTLVLQVWDVEHGVLQKTIRMPTIGDDPESFDGWAVSSDGRHLLAGRTDGLAFVLRFSE